MSFAANAAWAQVAFEEEIGDVLPLSDIDWEKAGPHYELWKR